MDETGSQIPEEVAVPPDDEITSENSPSKSIASLNALLARAQPVDVSKLITASESKPVGKTGLLGEIREKLKTAIEIKPGETPPYLTDSK